MKFVLSVAAVAGAFALVLLGGGTAAGVWEELELPSASEAADRATKSSKLAAARAAAEKRRVKARANARRAATKSWVLAVNQMCREAKAEAVRIRRPRSPAEVETYVARLAELSARYNARIAALPPPPGQRAKFRRLTKLFTKDEVLLSKLREAVRNRQTARMRRLGYRIQDVSERERQLLYDLGARRCALS